MRANNIQEVAHYTSIFVFNQIIEEVSRCDTGSLKLCSLAAANDPTEGRIFHAFLKGDCCTHNIFSNNLTVLQASFSASIDSLNQFRLYGKKSGKEGTGLCLVFDKSFFSEPTEGLSLIADQSCDHKYPLYWVLYYDQRKKEIYYTPAYRGDCLDNSLKVFSEKEKYRDKLEKISECLKSISREFNKLKRQEVREAALNMLIYLRHLIKDAAFLDEKELRILALHRYDNNSLEVLGGKNCLCCDYLPIFHEEGYLKAVIAGPKVENFMNMADIWKYKTSNYPGGEQIVFSQSEAPLN